MGIGDEKNYNYTFMKHDNNLSRIRRLINITLCLSIFLIGYYVFMLFKKGLSTHDLVPFLGSAAILVTSIISKKYYN